MRSKKRYIGILNNLISGIGIIVLGIIVTIGSINLYTVVVNSLVYIFIIFGLANLINFLLNRKIVRNAQTLLLIIVNIVLGVFMLLFPKLPLSIIPIVFSIYIFLNSVVKFINYIILKSANLKSRFRELLFCIILLIISFIFLFYPLDRLNLFIMMIGIYCIILGLSMINEFIMDILFKNTKSKVKKRFKISFPAFLEAFFPKRSLKKIDKYIDYIINEDSDKDNDDYLKIFIHLSNYSVNQFGHIDLMIDKKIYSYGNYDKSTRKLFNGLGDGVLFITDKKDEYIDFCLKNNRETIVEYGIEITDKQKEKIKSKINYILNDVIEWNPPVKENKKVKRLYYADKLYKAIKAKFYKFKSIELKTFFIAGVNCTYFINIILENNIFKKLKVVGILSPGTYYEYLEENYKSKNSNIKFRKIYKEVDINDKNKK